MEYSSRTKASFTEGSVSCCSLDIVRSPLPGAKFAFLSACHTAESTDEIIADELLHLAAAMQFCGFRSVVRTMWVMADTDGRDLASGFHQSVFSDGTQGTRHCENSDGASRRCGESGEKERDDFGTLALGGLRSLRCMTAVLLQLLFQVKFIGS